MCRARETVRLESEAPVSVDVVVIGMVQWSTKGPTVKLTSVRQNVVEPINPESIDGRSTEDHWGLYRPSSLRSTERTLTLGHGRLSPVPSTVGV